MKKRVRIYKSSDGEGKFINKTAKFLQRAQEGGVPDISMMGYPGAQQQSQELTDDELASVVLQDISNSAPREAIVVKLVNVFGKEPMEAMQFVDEMYNYVKQLQQSEIDSEDDEDDESEEILAGNDVMEIVQPVEEEESQSGTDMSNEMILEDDESDFDDDDAAADLIMKYGGYYRAQDGMEVPIEMPDVSAYLPENMFDTSGNPNYYGDTNAAAEIAWAAPQMDGSDEQGDINAFSGFETPEIPEEVINENEGYYTEGNALGNNDVYGDYYEGQIVDPESDPSIIEMKKGGSYKRNKKAYINSILKLVKKQMGGDNQDPKSADFTDDHADPTGSGIRKKNLNKFIGSIKNESSIAAAKKQAEQQYDQMMQQQQMSQQYPVAQGGGEQNIYQGQDYENPMHHLAAYSQAAGNVFNQDQNQMIQAKDGLIVNQDYNYPAGLAEPKVGQTFDEWWTSNGATPGYAPDNRKWDGKQWISQSLDIYRNSNESDKTWTRPKSYEEYQSKFGWPRGSMSNEEKAYEQEYLKNYYYPKNGYPPVGNKTGMDIDPGFSINPTTGKPWTRAEWETQKQKGVDAASERTRLDNWIRSQMNGSVPNPYNSGYNRGTYGGGYRMPAGFQGMPPITKIDVRKSGWLTGRPRQYSIEFGQGSPMQGSPMPGMGMPGQGAGFYGYGARTVRWPATRKKVVVSATSVNKEALKEVASQTPGSTATINAANPQIVSTVSTTTQGPVASIIQPGTTVQTETKTVDGKTETNTVNSKTVESEPLSAPMQYLKESLTVPTKPQPFSSDQLINTSGPRNTEMQFGGNTSQDMMGDNGELLKYVYGGDGYDDISQEDIDDVYSKNTANGDFPMARFGWSIGRGIRNYFPANVMPIGQSTRMQRGPYNPQTGQSQNFIPGAGTYLKNIDVKKSSWITGLPKKYTITYGNQEMDPRKQNIITLPGSGVQNSQSQGNNGFTNNNQRSNVDGLGLKARMAIRKGERQNERNSRRLERQGLDEYGNLIGSEQSDKVPMSNVEMLTKQGKVWDEKSNRWVDLNLPSQMPVLPVGQIDRKPTTSTLPIPKPYFPPNFLINNDGPRNPDNMQFGGDLRRFIPRADGGAETPVTYTSNPALAGMTDVDMLSLNPGISGINKSSFWNDQASFNEPVPERDKSKDPIEYKIDEEQPQSHQVENVYSGTEGDVSMDFKTKNNFDPQAYLNTGNAAARVGIGMINRAQDRKSERKIYENYNADNLYAAKTVMDQGDYDTNSGLYRAPTQGQKHGSRSKQYGGDVYQDGGYVEGDEVYMTDEEIQEFLANGGDLEFI